MGIDIDYKVSGRTYRGYLADGSNAQRVPGVLVIHGGGGLGAHAKERADRLAQMGYVAFAADLFGEPVHGVAHAKQLVAQFTEDWQELRTRCGAALQWLQDHPNVDRTRTAAIGFCFGGQAALELGRAGVELRAIVGFHSQLATRRPQDSANIKAKVLICVGDQDCFVSRSDIEEFMDNMTANRVDCQLLMFSGVGHSFTDPYAEASNLPGLKYDATADRRAWSAMQALFDETLHSNDV